MGIHLTSRDRAWYRLVSLQGRIQDRFAGTLYIMGVAGQIANELKDIFANQLGEIIEAAIEYTEAARDD